MPFLARLEVLACHILRLVLRELLHFVQPGCTVKLSSGVPLLLCPIPVGRTFL
jgi:hypothetical protein